MYSPERNCQTYFRVLFYKFVINQVNDHVWTQIMTIYFQTISHMHVNVTTLFIQGLVTADCSRYDILTFSDYRNINVF